MDNKFKILKQEDKWNAPSPKEEKILALLAKTEKFTKANKKGKENKKQLQMQLKLQETCKIFDNQAKKDAPALKA